MATTTYLSLEYESRYGTARGDLDVWYLINNPSANGLCSVHSVSLPEEGAYLGLSELRALLDDVGDA